MFSRITLARITACCAVVISTTMLLSCGGGGGDGDPAPVGDQASGGIWLGTWTGPGGGVEAALAFSTDINTNTGEARFSFFLFPSLIQMAGTVQVDGSQLWLTCGEGLLELMEVQAPGKRPMACADYLRGARLAENECWGRQDS